MPRVQVTCVSKRYGAHYEPHERIEWLGGPEGGGWRKREQQVIDEITAGRVAYYVHTGQYEVDVVVAFRLGRAYLKTRPYSTGQDNLLGLPECRSIS